MSGMSIVTSQYLPDTTTVKCKRTTACGSSRVMESFEVPYMAEFCGQIICSPATFGRMVVKALADTQEVRR